MNERVERPPALFFMCLAGLVYLAGLSFDLGISYSVYLGDKEFFLNHEANHDFVRDVRATGYFFASWQVVLAYSIVLVYPFFYLRSVLRDRFLEKFSFYLLTGVLFGKGLLHFMAGSSWL